MSVDLIAIAPYQEVEPTDRAILESAWRHLASQGHAMDGPTLRFEHKVDRKRLQRLEQLGLLAGRDDGWRPTIVGALYVVEARATLEAIDRLLRKAHELYRPGGADAAEEEFQDALGGKVPPGDTLREFLSDLGLHTFLSRVLVLDEKSYLLQDLATALRRSFSHLYGGGPPASAELPPAPFTLTPTAIEVTRFRSLRRVRIDLSRLNVFVGPNGVGKSALLEVWGFVGDALSLGLGRALDARGGLDRLRTRGETGRLEIGIEFTIQYPDKPPAPGRYFFSCGPLGDTMVVERETLTFSEGERSVELIDAVRGRARILHADGTVETQYQSAGTLVLSRLHDTEAHPLAVYIRSALREVVRIARDPSVNGRPDWDFASGSSGRLLAPFTASDELTGRLGRILGALVPSVRGMKRLVITGEAPELEVDEEGVPGGLRLSELSAGVRQLLLLAAIYLHPEPPSVLLLEEPEAGVHQESLPALADLLRSLAARTTVMATSHSAAFVSLLDVADEIKALARTDEGVVVQPYATAREAWLRPGTAGNSRPVGSPS